jgi:hypothetical protein
MPERIKSKFCRLKDEKVVNPPQIPTITNIRMFSGTANLPPVTVSVPKKPITKDPSTLMRTVLAGKCTLVGSRNLVSA